MKDYAQWKEELDNHAAARQAGGSISETLVMRNVEDPNEIVVVLGWCDLKQARSFSQSVSWQMATKKKGVVGVPEMCFLETAI